MSALKKQNLTFAELVSSMRKAYDLFSAQATYSQIVETVTPQLNVILKNKDQCRLSTSEILESKLKNNAVIEYALSDIHKPIGASAHQIIQLLPKSLKSSLPSIEDIEKELGGKE